MKLASRIHVVFVRKAWISWYTDAVPAGNCATAFRQSMPMLTYTLTAKYSNFQTVSKYVLEIGTTFPFFLVCNACVGVDISQYWLVRGWPETLAALWTSRHPYQRCSGECIRKLCALVHCCWPAASSSWKLSAFEAFFTCHLSLSAVLLRRLSFRCHMPAIFYYPLWFFQASNIELRFKSVGNAVAESVSFQIDGEPFSIPRGSV